MPTISICIPGSLKTRVATAENAGTTPHGFILEAIIEKTERTERRAALHGLADKRYAKIVVNGKTIPWAEMRRYLQQRVAGKSTARPKVKRGFA
jgi:hypothetical protein